MRIAAIVAAWASLGLGGCAKEMDVPLDETKPALTALEVDVEEDVTAEETSPETLMSVESTVSIEEEALIGPRGPGRRPPRCRLGARLVELPGGGFICRGGGSFAALPFCFPGWRLSRVGRGYICVRRLGPPLRPLDAEERESLSR
ncbi:Hypothetical protein A7982_11888 [Minicystis rosea]|nr:Hypothetical protein A7982_11888 [Minicystis rosea]